jgi:hypothetical protein
MTTTQLCSLKPVQSLLSGLVVSVAMLSLVAVAAPTARADAVDGNFVNS